MLLSNETFCSIIRQGKMLSGQNQTEQHLIPVSGKNQRLICTSRRADLQHRRMFCKLTGKKSGTRRSRQSSGFY